MDTAIFKKSGLTEGESKVYEALLRLGQSTVGAIGRQSRVSKSKLYDILDKLAAKGLVSYISKEGTKHFTAKDPNMLLEYVGKKEEEIHLLKSQLEKIMPALRANIATAEKQSVAEIYEGFAGFKTVREKLVATLRKGDELLVLGAPRIANERWEAWFLDFHGRRDARGVKMRIIYNSNAREFGEVRKRFKNTKVRYLPSELVSPNFVDIYKDAILFILILDEPLCIIIRNKALVASFRSYFDMMWKLSVE